MPFRDLRLVELGYAVVKGRRPEKPENAAAVGFSDSLWDFVQLCWHGDRTRRPKVARLVARLGEAAASWNELTFPPDRAEIITPVLREMEHGEFEILTLQCQSLSNEGRIANQLASPPRIGEYREVRNTASQSAHPNAMRDRHSDPRGNSRLISPSSGGIPATPRSQPFQMVHRFDDGDYQMFSRMLSGASAALG